MSFRQHPQADRTPAARPRLLWAAAVTAAAAAALSACGPTAPAADGAATPAAGDVAAAASPDAVVVSTPPSASPTPRATASVSPSKAKSGSAHSPGQGAGSGTGSGAGSASASGATVPVPANAPQAVQAAFRQARADGRNVLLDFGSTSCFACRTVHALYSDPSVKAEISAHYHLVEIDIDANMPLLQKYDSSGSYGLPVLIVVSPSGTIRVDTNKTGHPQLNKTGFLNWLTRWAA
ncbi:thioredoxin family protein [Streptacidiphilus anmyonensis]|uniref:thioredoxin family protein n=1 Tax=Streptacidiphilus anmyonensis TaxID=405782 RepID=UPI0005A86C0F|nr:thioredoxin family protein [Streptacidiphilus anmyonensis]